MTKYQFETIQREFDGFKPPECFAGGCKKSLLLQGHCAHLKPDGEIGKIEEGCRNYRECKGYNFRYHVTPTSK